MKIEEEAILSEYFKDEINKTSQKLSIPLSPFTKKYLVKLLERFGDASNYQAGFNSQHIKSTDSISEIFLKSQNLNENEKISQLQNLADYLLFTSGYFSEKLRKSLVDITYYEKIGRNSYSNVASLKKKYQGGEVFLNLSKKFPQLRSILEEISLANSLQSDNSIIQLYSKYEKSPSQRIARILNEQGILISKKASGDN